MNAHVLRLERVGKIYAGIRPTQALREATLDVAPGTFTVIEGPSGSGKTTLLAIAGGLERPTTGRVWVGDQEIALLPAAEVLRVRRRQLAFVFQDFKLIDALTAEENVALPLELRGADTRTARARGREALQRLGLAARAHHRPSTLSGGEKQRVAIARALVTEPRLILADEPTANLDGAAGREVVSILRETARTRGTAILVVSHDARLAERADRRVAILDGVLRANGHAPGNGGGS